MTEIAPGVYAITLRPDDDDSPQIYWASGYGGGAIIDAGHADEDVSQRVIAEVDRLRGDRPSPGLLLLTDRFDEHVGGAAALQRAYPGLITCAGDGDADAIAESTGAAIHRRLTGDESFVTVAADGERTIRAIATPGHTPGSTCYFMEPEGVLFSGDCVLSRGTTAVQPSGGGDMAAYVASLQRLAELNARLLLSFHGAPVSDPTARLSELIEHRRARDEAIIDCVREGVTDIDAMRDRLYGAANLSEWRWNAAREQIHAHLIKLAAENRVTELEPGRAYRLA